MPQIIYTQRESKSVVYRDGDIIINGKALKVGFMTYEITESEHSLQCGTATEHLGDIQEEKRGHARTRHPPRYRHISMP